jgi:cell division protein ZapA
MAQVTVTVNNLNYTLACDDGEEDHLAALAKLIDKDVSELKSDVGDAGDAHLILMTSLVLADDLALANERIQELEEELAGLKGEFADAPKNGVNGKHAVVDEEKFAGLLEIAARRMEDIAGRLG